MRDGFIKVAAVTPEIKVADCVHNAAHICSGMDRALEQKAKIIVFPELCMTGYTCGDLFWQDKLLREAKHELHHVLRHTQGKDALVFVGLPWKRTESSTMWQLPSKTERSWVLYQSAIFQIIMNFTSSAISHLEMKKWNG